MSACDDWGDETNSVFGTSRYVWEAQFDRRGPVIEFWTVPNDGRLATGDWRFVRLGSRLGAFYRDRGLIVANSIPAQSPVARRPSPVARRPSPVARRQSPVASRPSPVARGALDMQCREVCFT